MRTNRHNPFVALIALLMLFVLLFFMTGCTSADADEHTHTHDDEPRFTYERTENVPGGLGYIITDTTTGHQYLYISYGDDGGMVYLRPAEEHSPHEGYEMEAQYIAQTIWGEARGCSVTEQAAVAWCILNRVDSPDFKDDIISVITEPAQFAGYDPTNPVTIEHYELALDVIGRWQQEKAGETNVGRVLPNDYYWFHGDGKVNRFRDAFKGDFSVWDWSMASPYKEV